jgi:hypothetical protein
MVNEGPKESRCGMIGVGVGLFSRGRGYNHLPKKDFHGAYLPEKMKFYARLKNSVQGEQFR